MRHPRPRFVPPAPRSRAGNSVNRPKAAVGVRHRCLAHELGEITRSAHQRNPDASPGQDRPQQARRETAAEHRDVVRRVSSGIGISHAPKPGQGAWNLSRKPAERLRGVLSSRVRGPFRTGRAVWSHTVRPAVQRNDRLRNGISVHRHRCRRGRGMPVSRRRVGSRRAVGLATSIGPAPESRTGRAVLKRISAEVRLASGVIPSGPCVPGPAEAYVMLGKPPQYSVAAPTATNSLWSVGLSLVPVVPPERDCLPEKESRRSVSRFPDIAPQFADAVPARERPAPVLRWADGGPPLLSDLAFGRVYRRPARPHGQGESRAQALRLRRARAADKAKAVGNKLFGSELEEFPCRL